MDRETNIDSIRALEEQIIEHERAAIKLKRARNSLLNVSKFPPEVLGNIFRWNAIPKGDFDGLEEGSHNFLLVCHHWFEVASRTPELWSFWGNNPKDWSRWYRRPGTALLDLVLGGYGYDESYFDGDLSDALEDRAAKDTIRCVHLASGNTALVGSILDSLTANCEELRSSCMESFVLKNLNKLPLDVSDFFAHYRFPKLQRLRLSNCSISSWGYLTSRTSALTTLKLDFGHTSAPPAIYQSLSILASNPALWKVTLLRRPIPDGGGSESSRVKLHHLKELRLDGGLRQVFNLLRQLDHPVDMDLLSLTLHDCDNVDIPRIVGPYLRDNLRRCCRAQNGLNLFTSSGYRTYRAPHASLRLSNGGGNNFSDPVQLEINTFVEITMLLNGKHRDVRKRAVLDLVACIPREEVVYFKAQDNPIATEDTCTQFPSVRGLSFGGVPLSAAFPNPNLAGGKIFPSLEHATLERVDDDDWSPLMTFLASRVSSGNRLDTLMINDSPNMPLEAVGDIGDMVRELKINTNNTLARRLYAGPEP